MKINEFAGHEFLKTYMTNELLSRTIIIIDAYISDPDFNGNILSRELGISKRVLYQKLRKFAGQTVNEFIRTVRLQKSIKHLMDGTFNISQISTEMGFNSASYFTRSFKNYFGLSPKAYREKKVSKQPAGEDKY